MNKVILLGRLTTDPEMKYTGEGDKKLAIAKYTLAVDRGIKDKDGNKLTDFPRCTAFGKLGELAEKYLHKGDRVLVTGRIQTGSYKDKDGNTVYTTDVVLEEQEFVETKNKSGNGDNTGNQSNSQKPSQSTPAQPAQPAQPAGPESENSGFEEYDDDDFY